MDDVRFGRLVFVLRRRAHLRQADVAGRARVSPSFIGRIERGAAGSVRLDGLRRVGAVLGIRLELDARWHGGDEDRLLDAGHASLVEHVAALLDEAGWEVVPEYTFNHFGERGSVDIVAWHPAAEILLIVEVKTVLLDLQQLTARLDRKVRVVPRLIAAERGWRPRQVGRLLVVAESSRNRRVVAAHPHRFRNAFPQRSVESRRWVRQPSGALSGLWFLSGVPTVTLRQRIAGMKGPTA